MSSLKHSLKKFLRTLPAPILKNVILAKLFTQNRLTALKSKNTTDWVCAIGDFDAAERARYSDEVFKDYFKYSGIPLESLKGKKVLEIGPGENFAVALLCLAHGAESVTCIDRFPSVLPRGEQEAIYRELSKTYGTEFKIDDPRIKYFPNLAIEEIEKELKGEKFDLILSRAVLEHVYDMNQTFAAMDAILAPGGTMIHEVDFRDHAIFTSYGLHPLTFLTFSPEVWRLATDKLGAPNRKIENHFRDLLNKHGYKYEIKKILAVGSDKKFHSQELKAGETHERSQEELIKAIRPKLATEYQILSDSDLLTAGIFFTATKPKPQ